MSTMTWNIALTQRQVLRPAEEPLFRSANDALVFALHFSHQQYDRPLINRLAAEPRPSRRPALGGLDGAAQAAMILAELARLEPILQAALLTAKAPQSLPCSCGVACCAGHRLNGQWSEAVSMLASAAICEALSGCAVNRRLCVDLIQRAFGAKVSLTELAEKYQVDRDTASHHFGRIKRWLFGQEALGKRPAELGLYARAQGEWQRRIEATGIVGDVAE